MILSKIIKARWLLFLAISIGSGKGMTNSYKFIENGAAYEVVWDDSPPNRLTFSSVPENIGLLVKRLNALKKKHPKVGALLVVYAGDTNGTPIGILIGPQNKLSYRPYCFRKSFGEFVEFELKNYKSESAE